MQIKTIQYSVSRTMPVFHWLVISLCLSCALMATSTQVLAVAGAAPNSVIQNLPANTWYEVPNSEMRQVEATETEFPGIWGNHPDSVDPKPSNFQGSHGIFPWSGGAFDSKRNRMVLWGGGHNAYYGNELYAFDLTDFTWERVTNPSPPTDWANCIDVLADDNPNSRHTYYNLAYIPTIDKFFSTPAGTTSCDQSGLDYHTWTFDFDTMQWLSLKPATENYADGKPKQPPGWAPTAAAYNPLDDKVYSTGPEGLFAYDVATNRWDKLNSTALWEDRGAAVDVKRGLLVVVGRGEVVVYDLANQDYTPQFWDTQGDEAYNINNAFRPGVNYDPVADRIVVWDGGAVHALNMDTRQWDDLAVAPQLHHENGTYGRFRYSPRENAYVLVNDSRQNMLIYKLADASSTPSIVVQPEAVTVDQGQDASFSVLAVGTGTLAYQWQKNGVAIAGATQASYTFTASNMIDNGAVFDCEISNATGSIVSSNATLSIIADTVAPTVNAVVPLGPDTIQVVFNEPVETVSAQYAGNYSITPAATVNSAVLADNGQVLLLGITGLSEGLSYTLTLDDITDRAIVPNTMSAPFSQTFIYRTSEGFDDGSAASWEPVTPARWSVVQDGGDNAYSLNTSSFDSPGGGLLGEYSLLFGVYGDVVFSLNARLGDDVVSNGFADLALIFGYQDANNYYYMMFNNEMSATQLFKVESGARTELASATTDWLSDNAYHSIEITHIGNQIAVSFDSNAVLSVTDSAFVLGRLGIGSFNDSAFFDDISVRSVLSTSGGSSGGSSSGDSSSGGTSNGDSGGGVFGPLMGLALLLVRRRS